MAGDKAGSGSCQQSGELFGGTRRQRNERDKKIQKLGNLTIQGRPPEHGAKDAESQCPATHGKNRGKDRQALRAFPSKARFPQERANGRKIKAPKNLPKARTSFRTAHYFFAPSAGFGADAALSLNRCDNLPYPAFSRSATGINFKEAELMQYRIPVGRGPSGNKWPR